MGKRGISVPERSGLLCAIAAALTVVNSAPLQAYDFQFGDGWDGTWTSSLSLGSAMRVGVQDKKLIGRTDGSLVGIKDGTGNNTVDEGDLNYRQGDLFSSPIKLISEVEVKKDELGVLVRGKAWYDYTLENQDVHFGNGPNGFNGYKLSTNSLGSPSPLSDRGFETLNKYSGVELLDAYVYDTFQIAEKPLQLRAGQQVLNWGESLFVQGVNQINPIDVPALRKPGTQLKEVFIPVPIVSASQGLGHYGSVDAFYQVQWRNTPIDASCGNYWSVAEGSISADPASCPSAVSLNPAVLSDPQGFYSGAYIPAIQGQRGRDSGEFGLAYHINVEPLDTEFGFYGMQFNSRTPVINVHYGNFTNMGSLSPMAISWDYPNDMKVFGASASTDLFGWSVAGELSRTLGYPAQIDGNDLLSAGLGGAAGLALGPLGPTAVAAAKSQSGYLQGYTRTNKTQFQINTIKAGNGLGLGENQYTLIGEAAFQWNNLPDYKNNPNALRYNRAFIFGPGSSTTYGIMGANGNTCANGMNINAAGCANDGFVSNFSWGYRVKGELKYDNVWGTGVTVFPGLFWSHDVSGYSVDSQFLQDRMAIGLSLKFNYQQAYTLELDAVGYNPDAKYDPLRDRDYVAATFTVNF